MSDALVPCTSCGRHLRASSTACPFCSVAHTPREVAAPTRRLSRSRAAIFAFGFAMGCERGGEVPVYGAPAPPLDASADASVDAAQDPDADAVAVRYGAPPPPDAR